MNILKPKGKFDLLYFYSKIAKNKKIQEFLKNKEIASKIYIPGKLGFFIRRGSKDTPLFIEELASEEINDKFFELRTKIKREEAIKKGWINKLQEKIWLYFPPNKYIEFFYATNSEGKGKNLDRIFIDIDRSNIRSEVAQEVTLELVKNIKRDKEFNKMISYRIVILWTGSSFHVYLLLKKPVSLEFYNKYLSFSKEYSLTSFIGRWVQKIKDKTKLNVCGGHEKLLNTIIIDPSGTPSGKLARVPFSFHFKKPAIVNKNSIDGICIPINEKMLNEKKLISKLKKLNEKEILENLNKFSKNL